jgi:hypothetical protein
MALGLLLLLALCQLGGQSAASSSRQMWGAWNAGEAWSLVTTGLAVFTGYRHDWLANEMVRRDSPAADAQTSELCTLRLDGADLDDIADVTLAVWRTINS